MLALKWTALEPTTELEAILELDKATDWESFEEGLEQFLAPAQNFVFASRDGTIAYKANGNIPIYEDGNDALLPMPGWDKKYELDEYIPFDELPTVVNPDEGFIASANNKVAGDDYPYHISNNWAQSYRYERIAEVLADTDDLTRADMQDLQMDAANLQAKEFVSLFADELADAELSDTEQEALDVLADWDFRDDVDAPQPLIFHSWMDEIEAQLYDDAIPESMMRMFEGSGQTTDELLRMGDESIWIDDNGGLKEVLHTSLENTMERLGDDFGADVSAWEWGDFHRVAFPHPLSDASAILEHFLNPEDPVPARGSSVTPMAASYDEETGIVDHGASWRFVIDAEDMARGEHIVGPGQAGHFRSEWYHDQLDDWVDGDYHETRLDEADGKELRLEP